MQDREIQNGAQLTVRASQTAIFVDEGRAADAFAPGRYTLSTQTLPILTYLRNWDKAFQSPFKSDVYFFSNRLQTAQPWGTSNPVTIRDKEFGAVRVRGYGIYAYRVADAKLFHEKVSGTRDLYRVEELEGQLRNTIVGRMADTFGESQIPFLDMAANQVELGERIAQFVKPDFAALGLELHSFVVESLSLPDELQRRLDERIGMTMIGDMGRYTQFQVAQSIPIAAGNEGGGVAGIGAGLGAGVAMGQAMAGAMTGAISGATTGATQGALQGARPPGPQPPDDPSAPPPANAAGTKFCTDCGSSIARNAKFCSECGHRQG
jgi:membrane protease subunit (stomatin/prohibitin family)